MKPNVLAYQRNGLGNMVLLTPALQALASLDESGKIDLCFDSAWQDNRRNAMVEFCKALPFINEVIEFPDARLENYKRYFYTNHAYHSKALEFFQQKDRRLNIGRLDWEKTGQHEIEYYMDHVRRFFGYSGETPKQYCPRGEKPVLDHTKPIIVLCNGSYGHLAASKQWPWFAQLSEALKAFYDATIIKLGYGTELEGVPADFDYVEKLPVLESLKVLSQADLFVTTDTFLMHCADALKVPMVCIWGGSVVSKNQPVNGKARLVKLNMGCQPCHESKADAYRSCVRFPCLSGINPNQVMAACREMLP